ATKYEDKYLQGTYENGEQVGGRIEYVRFFSLIAVFIMGIACINFMNLATARASRRFKEIGIKKVAGAKRGTLAGQYLLEAVLVALVSLALALIMVLLVLPIFNQITGKQLHLQLSWEFLILLIGLAVGTGILSGSYPALYLSGFKPIAILKGRLNASTGELWTRRGLVVIQYAIAAVLIVLVTVIYQQMDYIQNKNLGYNKDQVLHFYIEGKLGDVPQLESFLTEVKRLSGVQRASAARVAMTGDTWGVGGIRWPGSTPEDYTYFQHVIAYDDLFEALDIEMATGRAYSSAFTNEDKKVIFNEAAIAFMGLEDPIGKQITFWGQEKEIIGVVKNFHFASFHEKIAPMIINYWPDRLSSIIVKIESGQESGVLSEIEALYESHNPGFLFDAKFLDSNFQELYASEKRVSTLSTNFAGIAILIACLGLFGLAAFTAERRVKEIGIRKVMGASLFNIVYMLSTGFAKLVMIAVVLALPISYFLASQWLEGFSYRIDLVWWYFVGSGLLVLLIAVLTVGGQTVRAALQNPVKNLRSE
ncbi:MAG: FtsX-like permease family protein, partial [Bacteroidota bacterium]